MSIDYSQKDLDVLIAQLNQAVTAVCGDSRAAAGKIENLVSIAETALEHARSVRLGHDDSDFIRKLIRSVNLRHEDGQDKVPIVTNSHGKLIGLGKCIGRGGEGMVYKIPAMPGKAAKIYFPNRLATDDDLHEKISLLSRKKKIAHVGQTMVAALPDELLYRPDGSFVGYIMPQVSSTVRIYDILRDIRREALFPDLDYRGLVAIAYNLAEVVDHMHKHGIVIGDLSGGNFLVHQDGTIALIDCDSFDITDERNGKHYPCVVGLQELLAPELQQVGSLRNGRFSKASDNFSLAIHIFRLLMGNADPFGFQVTDGISNSAAAFESSDNTILNGECVFVRNLPGKQRPSWAPSLEILPEEIQSLFRRTFSYTADTISENIANRPTAEEWMLALQHLYEMPMIKCPDDPFHYYLPTQTECPFCRI